MSIHAAAAESLHVPFTLVSCGNAGCCSGTPLGSGTEPLLQPYKHSPSMTSVAPSKQPQLTFGNAGRVFVRDATQPTIWNPNVKFPIEQRSEQNTVFGIRQCFDLKSVVVADEKKQPEQHTI